MHCLDTYIRVWSTRYVHRRTVSDTFDCMLNCWAEQRSLHLEFVVVFVVVAVAVFVIVVVIVIVVVVVVVRSRRGRTAVGMIIRRTQCNVWCYCAYSLTAQLKWNSQSLTSASFKRIMNSLCAHMKSIRDRAYETVKTKTLPKRLSDLIIYWILFDR